MLTSEGFWFFAARNNPKTAPISTWFNGGPGCSSMIGLLQENGPCKFVGNSKEPVRNPYSFNEYANMLYVDQPIGVGFSYGLQTTTSTVTAAPMVWKLLQAFFKKFPQYESRDFGIFTESYGGHYGPEFADEVQDRNKAIAAGTQKGEKIDIIALGINNGIADYSIQEPAYIDYALDNKYNKIIDKATAARYHKQYKNRCAPLLKTCTTPGSPLDITTCAATTEVCFQTVEGPITGEKDFDVYDVRQPAEDPFPPQNYLQWLNRADIQKKIGAKQMTFAMCDNSVGLAFTASGDGARSFLPKLSEVTRSGIQVLIWAGDADYICNYKGWFGVVQAIEYGQQKAFRNQKLKPYMVNGKEKGLYKTAGNLSWIQVYEAGHEVPYYQPAAALQAFRQTMMRRAVSST